VFDEEKHAVLGSSDGRVTSPATTGVPVGLGLVLHAHTHAHAMKLSMSIAVIPMWCFVKGQSRYGLFYQRICVCDGPPCQGSSNQYRGSILGICIVEFRVTSLDVRSFALETSSC
jgi:hypothetical protein